jgi:DNA-directed RNA polymerase specialized sigma24 family protein
MRRDEVIPTRASLLERLKDLGDASSWDEFHRTYRELIFSVARRAGLNETEADEVVQDTLISVAKKMPGFTYDPAKDSFKGWLLTVTRWRILDQLEKRRRVNPALSRPSGTLSHPMGEGRSEGHVSNDATSRTATVEPPTRLGSTWRRCGTRNGRSTCCRSRWAASNARCIRGTTRFTICT